MLEKWKKCAIKGKVFGALLTDPSKPFDCLDLETECNLEAELRL